VARAGFLPPKNAGMPRSSLELTAVRDEHASAHDVVVAHARRAQDLARVLEHQLRLRADVAETGAFDLTSRATSPARNSVSPLLTP